MPEHILSTKTEMVAIITINRPDIRNAISDADVLSALVDRVSEADSDRGIRAIMLTGAGSSFSAGGNMKEIRSDLAGRIGVPATRDYYRNSIQRLTETMESLMTPVVAAVNGPAIGLGCDLACMCDIRIGSPAAQFAMPFVKLGLVPGDGGVALLPRIVGFARATEMILTGEPVAAQAALEYGLLSKIVPEDRLTDAALATARVIAANAPVATGLARRMLRRESGRALADTLELSAALQAVAHSSADHREAVSALTERRTPEFEGR